MRAFKVNCNIINIQIYISTTNIISLLPMLVKYYNNLKLQHCLNNLTTKNEAKIFLNLGNYSLDFVHAFCPGTGTSCRTLDQQQL